MLLLAAAVSVGVVVAILRGGSLDDLARTRFRLVPVLFGGLALQVVASAVAAPDGVAVAGFLAANAAMFVFVAANRWLPGMRVALVGLVLNVAVIGANGAMPVSLRAAEIAGVESPDGTGAEHELLRPGSRLPWLADVIPVPWTGSVLSVGDVLLAAGMGRLVYRRTLGTPGTGAGESPDV